LVFAPASLILTNCYLPLSEALYSYGGLVKYLSIFLVFFLVFKAESKSHSYSGGVSTYSESDSIIALHSHGVEYDSETSKLNSFSFIKFISKNSFDSAIVIENTPNLLALAWSSDGEHLVGISNIQDEFSPHYIVYDSKGNVVGTKTLNCESYESRNYSFFCSRNPEQHWSNRQINSLKVNDSVGGLDVCIGKLCVTLKLKTKSTNFYSSV
jgi:hypothetical protein